MAGLPALSSPSLSALPMPSRAQESVWGVGDNGGSWGGDRGNTIYSRSPSSKLQTVLWKKSRQPDSVRPDRCCLGDGMRNVATKTHTQARTCVNTDTHICMHTRTQNTLPLLPSQEAENCSYRGPMLPHLVWGAAMFKAPWVEAAKGWDKVA